MNRLARWLEHMPSTNLKIFIGTCLFVALQGFSASLVLLLLLFPATRPPLKDEWLVRHLVDLYDAASIGILAFAGISALQFGIKRGTDKEFTAARKGTLQSHTTTDSPPSTSNIVPISASMSPGSSGQATWREAQTDESGGDA